MTLILKKIQQLASELKRNIKIMEVCGSHTHTIVKNGLRQVIPKNIDLISGPGCPVCVSAQKDIDQIIYLALQGIKIATYGDMVNVPGSFMSLKQAQEKGAQVKIIYSVEELLADPEQIFFAIGFETTAPMTTLALKEHIRVFSTHKLVPPALKILEKDMAIDGFIIPGHVSTILGSDIWQSLNLKVPQVIAGFGVDDVLEAIYLILKEISLKSNRVINHYPKVVTAEGNLEAQKLMSYYFKRVDMEWRGLGILPLSGLAPKDKNLDARLIFQDLLKKVPPPKMTACHCAKVVTGKIKPQDCPLFNKMCNPQHPQGACMVSPTEGACAIAYLYDR